MRVTTWIGATLTLVGIVVLVVANGKAKQTPAVANTFAAVDAPVVLSSPPPAPPIVRHPVPVDSPTIFDTLLGVLDSTDDNGTLDKNQRDQLRRDLTETAPVWRGMKDDMKESILRANRRFSVKPNRDLPDLPAP